MNRETLDKWRHYNNVYLIWAHERTHPVVQVVMYSLITDCKLELFQKTHVIHHIEGTEDIKALLLVRKQKKVVISTALDFLIKLKMLKFR